MKRVLTGVLLGCSLVAARAVEARPLDRRDANEIANEAAHRIVTDDAETIRAMLAAQGMSPAEARSTAQRLVDRLVREVRGYVDDLQGRPFDSFEEAERAVAQRRLILRFSALNSPAPYAQGRPLSYVVSESEAARLDRGLLATWIEREALLRRKLDEMVMMQEISTRDVPAIRAWSKKLALERGKEAIRQMRGAGFFSKADADYFLECAVVAEIEKIRTEKLSDPIQRPRFVEDAVVSYGALEDGAFAEPPAMLSGRTYDDPMTAAFNR